MNLIMNIKRIILLVMLLVLGLASCANPDKVAIAGPVSLEVASASKVDAGCMIRNCSAHRITLVSAKFTLHYAAENMATVLLAEPVVVKKCSEEYVELPLRIRFANPLMALTAANLESLDWDNLYVTGEGVVRSGIGRKKIRLHSYPVREFLTIFESGGGIRIE